MSTSTPIVSTGTNGEAITGTSGTTLTNPSSTEVSGNEFLQLMMVQLQNQDPTSPDSSDPSQFLTELAQMTQVEQETDTAQSTASSASEQAVASAVALIGDTVTYTDQTTGEAVSGAVNSVQITAAGPTLTVDGVASISPSTVTSVTPNATASGSTT